MQLGLVEVAAPAFEDGEHEVRLGAARLLPQDLAQLHPGARRLAALEVFERAAQCAELPVPVPAAAREGLRERLAERVPSPEQLQVARVAGRVRRSGRTSDRRSRA